MLCNCPFVAISEHRVGTEYVPGQVAGCPILRDVPAAILDRARGLYKHIRVNREVQFFWIKSTMASFILAALNAWRGLLYYDKIQAFFCDDTIHRLRVDKIHTHFLKYFFQPDGFVTSVTGPGLQSVWKRRYEQEGWKRRYL